MADDSSSEQQQQQPPSAAGQQQPSPAVSESPVEAQKRELEVVRRTHGWNHPKTAAILSTIGLYHQHVDRNLSEALSYFEQALSVLYSHQCNPPAAPGDDDSGGRGCEVEVAVTLTDVGNVLRCMHRCEEAIKAYQQAMVIFKEKATSSNHPAIQAASRGLALLAAYSTNSEEDGKDGASTKSKR